jgi:DNA-binding CsgD family transcriptional regulator
MLSIFKDRGLTPAETSIVTLVMEGYINREIAKRLFICPQTLKTHLNSINKKLPEACGLERIRRHVRLNWPL